MLDTNDKWEHQPRAVSMLRDSLMNGCRRPLLNMPTGAGKTEVARMIFDNALTKGKRVLFTVPFIELVEQTAERFWAAGIRDIGIIQGSHIETNYMRPVQIASVQTLMRRPMPETHIAIVDEAHKWFEFYDAWFANANYPIIGLSATPWARGLGQAGRYDDLIVPTTIRELIAKGVLSPFKVYAPTTPKLDDIKTVAGDYHEGQLSARMSSREIVADVVDTWIARGEGRSTLVFAVDRAHAKALVEKFQASGVPTGYVDAYTSKDERKAIREQFHGSKLKVVVNIGTLTTGVDWDVRCIVLARPTKSEMLFVQMVGRGLRQGEGKDHCLILDHSDNHHRLGFVTEIVYDHLDDGKTHSCKPKAKDEEELPKVCPQCFAMKPKGVRACVECGFVTAPPQKVKTKAGSLDELSESDRAATVAQMQAFYSGLLGYAMAKGKKEGWAYYRFIDKFKMPPPRALAAIHAEPTPDVIGFIRHCNIRNAKSKGGFYNGRKRDGLSARSLA